MLRHVTSGTEVHTSFIPSIYLYLLFSGHETEIGYGIIIPVFRRTAVQSSIPPRAPRKSVQIVFRSIKTAAIPFKVSEFLT